MLRVARATLLVSICAAALSLPARAIESNSASYKNSRSSLDSGGARKTSPTLYRADGSAGTVTVSTGSSTSYLNRDGWMGVAFQPARITDLWASSTALTTSILLQWTAPGNDGDEATTAGSFVIKYTSIAVNAPGLSNANFEAAAAVPVPAPAPGPRGTRHQLTVTGLSGGTTYYFSVKTGERDGVRALLSAGATAQTRVLPPTSPFIFTVGISSIGVQYGTVGADGYVVSASTAADFTGTLYSSSTLGPVSQLAPQNLDPNTTYYLRTGALWNQTTAYSPTVLSTSTLSKLVTGTTVYQINVTSMVVNWAALASVPPDVSSNSSSGYLLQVSSRADFTPLWTSSRTADVALSTLTAGSLRGGVTYYFRVGSLNWNNVPNFAAAVSTLMPVQLGVEMSTRTISLPGLTPMGTTIVIATSTVLTNTGNVKETYWIRATTVTAGSPWTLAATPGADRYVLWSLVNPTEPAPGDFSDADDKLADAEAACTGAVFSMGGGDCVTVPVGAARTLWHKIATPLVTSTVADQDIRIFARAVRDPDPDPNP